MWARGCILVELASCRRLQGSLWADTVEVNIEFRVCDRVRARALQEAEDALVARALCVLEKILNESVYL